MESSRRFGWMHGWMEGWRDACKRPQSQNKNNRNPSEIQTARCSHSWAWLRSAPQDGEAARPYSISHHIGCLRITSQDLVMMWCNSCQTLIVDFVLKLVTLLFILCSSASYAGANAYSPLLSWKYALMTLARRRNLRQLKLQDVLNMQFLNSAYCIFNT